MRRIRLPKRLPKGFLVVLAILVPFLGGLEGLRLVAYRDIGGVPTICYGETLGVHMGERATKAECTEQFKARILYFYQGVRRCVHVKLTPGQAAASTSLAYNIGLGAFCRSTFVRHLNAGDPHACKYILWFDKQPQLRRRRIKERDLCRHKG